MDAIISAMPPRARIGCQLALAAGLRQAELFGLTPDDVDVKARTITVRHQWRQVKADGRARDAMTAPKGNKTRVVPVPASLIMALQAHRQAFGLSVQGTFLALANGNAYTTQQWAQEWTRARQGVGSRLLRRPPAAPRLRQLPRGGRRIRGQRQPLDGSRQHRHHHARLRPCRSRCPPVHGPTGVQVARLTARLAGRSDA